MSFLYGDHCRVVARHSATAVCVTMNTKYWTQDGDTEGVPYVSEVCDNCSCMNIFAYIFLRISRSNEHTMPFLEVGVFSEAIFTTTMSIGLYLENKYLLHNCYDLDKYLTYGLLVLVKDRQQRSFRYGIIRRWFTELIFDFSTLNLNVPTLWCYSYVIPKKRKHQNWLQ